LFYSPGVKQPKPHPQKRNFGKKTTQKRRQEYLNFSHNDVNVVIVAIYALLCADSSWAN
jgi:hypothetical protein